MEGVGSRRFARFLKYCFNNYELIFFFFFVNTHYLNIFKEILRLACKPMWSHYLPFS